MAILPEALFHECRGAQISTEPSLRSMPPATMAPRLLLTGINLVHRPGRSIHGLNTMNLAVCPSPGNLFDCVRPWGAVRQIRARCFPKQGGSSSPADCRWNAMVEFWYEQDALAFQFAYSNNAERLIQGWRM